MCRTAIWLPVFAFALLCVSAEALGQEDEWVRVWPCEANGAKEVRDAGGKKYPSTGDGSNTWFKWGGAGGWKRFKVRKGVPVIIRALGDSGPGACLGHVAFRLSELEDGKIKEKFIFEGPDWSGVAPQGEPQVRLVYFVPRSEKFEIACMRGGFYIWIYQMSKKKKEALTEEERAKAAALIEKLGCDSWPERERAQKELLQMGEKILPLLGKQKDSPDVEVRVRIKKIIEALTPLTGEAVSEAAMKRQASELVVNLAAYIKAGSLGCDSEPAKSLAAIGPYAVEPLEKKFDSRSEHVRAAVIQALGKLASTESLETILSALKDDKAEEVRYQAAKALARFDSEETLKALKAASENDTSERVCKQAVDSLQKIKSRKTGKKENE